MNVPLFTARLFRVIGLESKTTGPGPFFDKLNEPATSGPPILKLLEPIVVIALLPLSENGAVTEIQTI